VRRRKWRDCVPVGEDGSATWILCAPATPGGEGGTAPAVPVAAAAVHPADGVSTAAEWISPHSIALRRAKASDEGSGANMPVDGTARKGRQRPGCIEPWGGAGTVGLEAGGAACAVSPGETFFAFYELKD
jgi:hypothetical protein